jgi:Acyl-CoA carboxylase epsilon subunit
MESTESTDPMDSKDSAQSAETDDADEPFVITVVRGEPTAEELAGLIAVLAARTAADADTGPGAAGSPGALSEQEPAGVRNRTPSGWTDRSRYVRGRHVHGPGGWRASALPR